MGQIDDRENYNKMGRLRKGSRKGTKRMKYLPKPVIKNKTKVVGSTGSRTPKPTTSTKSTTSTKYPSNKK